MKQMSFAITTEQILNQSKTVTRRMRWLDAKPGDVVQPIEKGQGLKKGEKVRKLGGPIRFIAVDRVVLGDITPQDVFREGFPKLTTREFIRMFKQHNGCRRDSVVTRIEFEYVETPA